MIKVAICDDDIEELNRTSSSCLAYFSQYPDLELKITTYLDATDVLMEVEQQYNFDIIFLDIYMPNMSGIELAASIRERNAECNIIFLTSSTNHAIEAFSLNATHYVVKPYTNEQFDAALSKAFLQVTKRKKGQIMLKSSIGMHKILFSELIFAETEMHIQHIHLIDGTVVKVRMTSIELFEKLNHDKRFFKCGSTYIINLEKIKEITTKTIALDNNEKNPNAAKTL